MRPMLLSFLAIAVIAVGSDIVMPMLGFSAEEQAAGDAVRLGSAD